MKIINVKFIIEYPRFNFDRSLAYSECFDVLWLLGWARFNTSLLSEYTTERHIIIQLGGSESVRKRLLGLWDELCFVLVCIKLLNHSKNSQSELVIVHSHRLAFLYPILCPKRKYVLQLYTTAVSPSIVKRKFWDFWEWLVSRPYKTVFVGTAKMIDLFKLSHKQCYVTRWGMNPVSKAAKRFTDINLLYIGVLSGRRIHETVAGLRMFLDDHPHVHIKYSIIGSGKPEYVNLIKRAIDEHSLGDTVDLLGYLNDDEIQPIFDSCNVGVSYVPITPYYNDVIVTKTVEYLISGMAVIATDTNENRKMINESNGVLIPDTPEGFAQGLTIIYSRMLLYDSGSIIANSRDWMIDYNTGAHIVPIFDEIFAQS